MTSSWLTPDQADALDALREHTSQLLFEDAARERARRLEQVRADFIAAVREAERGERVSADQLWQYLGD